MTDIERVVSATQDVSERHPTTMPSSSLTKQDEATFDWRRLACHQGSFDAPTSSLRLTVSLLRTFDYVSGLP